LVLAQRLVKETGAHIWYTLNREGKEWSNAKRERGREREREREKREREER
jgi:DNA replication protein DnaC